MPEKKEKFEPKTNIPVTVELGRQFWSGQTKFGKTQYAYDIKEGGVEKIWFVTEKVHAELSPYKVGTLIVVRKEEVKREDGKTYPVTHIQEALFDDKGTVTDEPIDPMESPEAMTVVTDGWAKLYQIALQTALGIAKAYNENLSPMEDEPSYALNHEDIRAMAISLVIDFNRKH